MGVFPVRDDDSIPIASLPHVRGGVGGGRAGPQSWGAVQAEGGACTPRAATHGICADTKKALTEIRKGLLSLVGHQGLEPRTN